jgi:O-succinylbenzoic acid--CoA ligase
MLLRCYRDGSIPTVHGWFATGDLGAVGPDGRLQVHGRRGDLIISGGENVWPAAVEAALVSHPGVAEVAVAGVPDDEWGQRIVAWVVPRDQAAPPTLGALRAHVADSLPAFMAPKEVRLVDTLPTTSSGKVRRHELSI